MGDFGIRISKAMQMQPFPVSISKIHGPSCPMSLHFPIKTPMICWLSCVTKSQCTSSRNRFKCFQNHFENFKVIGLLLTFYLNDSNYMIKFISRQAKTNNSTKYKKNKLFNSII